MLGPRAAKTAQFDMVALTDAMGASRGRISSTHGEISYDSSTTCVMDLGSGEKTAHATPQMGYGHCGGDEGLALAFVWAVSRVECGEMGAEDAQISFLGCTMDEFRSHIAVFWAEDARRKRTVLEWGQWCGTEVEGRLRDMEVEVK